MNISKTGMKEIINIFKLLNGEEKLTNTFRKGTLFNSNCLSADCIVTVYSKTLLHGCVAFGVKNK